MQLLRGGAFTLSRGLCDGLEPILLVAAAGDYPSRESLQRLEHEYASVEDTGTGLDAAVAHRIFEPLFTTKPDGLGMGLSICRSIIQAHGGQLWAAARETHGTALRFSLPAGADR